MPILPDDENAPSQVAVDPTPETKPIYTFGEALEAAAEQGFSGQVAGYLGSNLGAWQAQEYDRMLGIEVDPDYDPMKDIRGYEDHADAFINAREPWQVAAIKARIDRSRENREVLAETGWSGFAAQIAAGVVDPVNFIPVGGAVARARTGGNILRGALEAAGIGALAIGAEELIIQQIDPLQTNEESMTNVLLGSVFFGAAGAAGTAFPDRPRVQLEFEREFEAALKGEVYGDGSLSAAQVISPRDNQVAGSLGLLELEAKNPIADNPLARTRTSPSPETAKISGQLAETPYYLTGNDRGVASPVAAETAARMWQAPLARTTRELEDLFLAYRGVTPDGPVSRAVGRIQTGVADLTGQGQKLSFGEFKEEVAKAMRRNDEHPIPEVAQAARAYRERVVEPLKQEAIKLGLFDEGVDVTTADSYLTRLWDFQKITASRNKFIDDVLVPWLESRQDRMAREMAKQADGFERVSPAELRGIAEDITASLLGSPPGRTVYQIPESLRDGLKPNLRGPLKDRTLDIPDVLAEDFLVNDVTHVLSAYTRTMATDLELVRAFGRADMADQLQAIRESYNRLLRKAKDGKETQALQKRMERDLSDIAAMRDRIRGAYALPDNADGLAVRLGRSVRNFNYIRMLGGMTLSAIPDMARAVTVHGMTRVLGEGLQPLVSRLAGSKGFKLAAEEVQLAGQALDIINSSRAMQLADVWEDFGRYSKFERGLQGVADRFGNISLMNLWNTNMKQFVGVITQTRILKAVTGKPTPAELRRLRFLGIDDDMSQRIAREFRKHGQKDGAWWANTEAWTDAEARRTYRAALSKEVDIAIVTPGQEKPLWMSTELGKTIGQFRSFTFSAMSRMLINGLQQRDINVLQGFAVATTMGMLTYYLKTRLSGREVSDNPAKWVEEGVANSGMLGWFFDANDLLEKASANKLGINPLIGEEGTSKYATRGRLETILGPSAGLVNDTFELTGSAFEGKFTKSDLKKARRLVPFQNLFYARWLFDQAEQEMAEDLPGEER